MAGVIAAEEASECIIIRLRTPAEARAAPRTSNSHTDDNCSYNRRRATAKFFVPLLLDWHVDALNVHKLPICCGSKTASILITGTHFSPYSYVVLGEKSLVL